MEFGTIPTGAGSFFKPADVANAPAILVEVKRFEAQRPGNYGPKDTIHADVHVFADAAAVEAGAADVSSGSIIQNSMLVRDLQPLLGKAAIVKLEQVDLKNSPNKGWVWRKVDAATEQKVIAYAQAYTERLKAEMDDAPAFV